MRCNVEKQREKQEIQGMNAALQRTKYQIIIRDLSTMKLRFLFVLERGEARNRIKPVEDAIEDHKIIRSIEHANSRNGSPSKERGSSKRDTSEQEAFERKDDRGVFDLNPFELKWGPGANQEIGLGAKESSEDSERKRIKSEIKRGTEEECNLGKKKRKPNTKKGTRLEIERIKDIRNHKAKSQSGNNGGAAEVEKEGSRRDKGNGNPRVVDEGRRRESGIPERSGGRGRWRRGRRRTATIEIGTRVLVVWVAITDGGEGRGAGRGGDVRAKWAGLKLWRHHFDRRQTEEEEEEEERGERLCASAPAEDGTDLSVSERRRGRGGLPWRVNSDVFQQISSVRSPSQWGHLFPLHFTLRPHFTILLINCIWISNQIFTNQDLRYVSTKILKNFMEIDWYTNN